jgi:urea transport system ATP-binding protein
LSEHEIAAAGIGRKFQRPTVFPNHTVFENLELALSADKGMWRSLFWRLTAEQHDRIDQVLHTISLSERAHTLAALLARREAVAGDRHAARAGPRVLLVDGRSRA